MAISLLENHGGGERGMQASYTGYSNKPLSSVGKSPIPEVSFDNMKGGERMGIQMCLC